MFITYDLYDAFVQIRKNTDKIKTRYGMDKYSMIEHKTKKYKYARRFCDAVTEMNLVYNTNYSAQEVLDWMFDHRKYIKNYVI